MGKIYKANELLTAADLNQSFADKAEATHDHPVGAHNHDGEYQPVGLYADQVHEHPTLYAEKVHSHPHDHDADYSAIDHNHDGEYLTDPYDDSQLTQDIADIKAKDAAQDVQLQRLNKYADAIDAGFGYDNYFNAGNAQVAGNVNIGSAAGKFNANKIDANGNPFVPPTGPALTIANPVADVADLEIITLTGVSSQLDASGEFYTIHHDSVALPTGQSWFIGVVVDHGDEEITTRLDDLEARLTVVEDNIAPSTQTVLNTDVTVYADGKAATADPLGSGGWYYTNAGDGTKINWYFFGQGGGALTELVTLADLNSVYGYFIPRSDDTRIPFAALYTAPQGDGNDAATWYRTRIVWELLNTDAGVPQPWPQSVPGLYDPLLAWAGQADPDVFTNVSHYQMQEQGFTTVGPKEDTEVVMFLVIGSDSSEGAGGYNFVLKTTGADLAEGGYESTLIAVPGLDVP